tara:strand:- start:692 stop:910 length:219 start_codon:yes stop_codon:yes gene_type:complete
MKRDLLEAEGGADTFFVDVEVRESKAITEIDTEIGIAEEVIGDTDLRATGINVEHGQLLFEHFEEDGHFLRG